MPDASCVPRRSTGSGSECDAPRVAVEPDVLSQVARERGRRQNIRHPTRRRVIVGAVAGCAAQRSTCRGGRRTDAGAAGNNGRHFSLLKSDRTHFRIHEKWRLSGRIGQQASLNALPHGNRREQRAGFPAAKGEDSAQRPRVRSTIRPHSYGHVTAASPRPLIRGGSGAPAGVLPTGGRCLAGNRSNFAQTPWPSLGRALIV